VWIVGWMDEKRGEAEQPFIGPDNSLTAKKWID
jgi:hypothetical protein